MAISRNWMVINDIWLDDGDDLDGDGDADVSKRISVVNDGDGDGDLEFPVGFYKAGTIFDNDVEFNTTDESGMRFTVDDADVDTDWTSVDLMAVAVHEFGHSHGLCHSPVNQLSPTEGRSAVMYPIVDTTDPVSERAA